MATATVNGLEIEYHHEGEGPPLLLLAGVGSNADSWGPRFLDAVRKKFRILRVSNRGMGLSGIDGTPITQRLMADDAAAVLASLGIERTHVFGYSMGGFIAQELALAHPEMVQKLVLGCTNCGPSRSVPQAPQQLGRLGKIMSAVAGDQVRGFCLSMVSEEFAGREVALMDELVAMHRSTSMAAFARQMQAIQAFDSFDRVPGITAETLIIHGDQDVVINCENAGLLAESIPGSTVRIVPGAGHMFMWERPEETVEMLCEFLGV
jgi:pimeloyl-ACP methyl ester carboxylesterase